MGESSVWAVPGPHLFTPTQFSVAIPTGEAVQTICISGTLADLKITGDNIKWYDAASGGSILPSTTVVEDGKHYFAGATKHLCEAPTRLDVKVIVNPTPTPAPTGLSSQYFCGPRTIADLVVSGTNIKWYSGSTGGVLCYRQLRYFNDEIYYASQTLGRFAKSATRFAVAVTVNTTATPTGNPSQAVCAANDARRFGGLRIASKMVRFANILQVNCPRRTRLFMVVYTMQHKHLPV
ncbi:MAG: hypothetical protein WDO15_06615 [Bacteroidota bacterium]